METPIIAVFIGSILTLVGVAIAQYNARKILRIQIEHQSENLQLQLKNQSENLSKQLAHQAAEQIRTLNISKLENLHLLISEQSIKTSDFASAMIIIKNTGLNFNKYLDAIAEFNTNFPEINSFIRIYSPSVGDEYDKLVDLHQKIINVANQYSQTGNEASLQQIALEYSNQCVVLNTSLKKLIEPHLQIASLEKSS